MKFVFFILILLLPILAGAESAPYSTNRIDWYGYVGIPGGIPNRSIIYTNFTSANSAADINQGIADCPSNQVVLLSAGTYTFSSSIQFLSNDGVTLRGETNANGIPTTIINSSTTFPFTSEQYSFAGAASISSGYTKGSSNIVMAATPNAQMTIDNQIKITAADDTNFVLATTGIGRHLTSTHIIRDVVGNTITFWPPLMFTYTAGQTPEALYLDGGPGLTMSGIENIVINESGTNQNAIQFTGTYACWVYNCIITNYLDTGIQFNNCTRNEIRHTKIINTRNYPNQGDGFALYLYYDTCFTLVEDNIVVNTGGMLGTGSSGNVIIFNYSTNSTFSSSGWQTPDYNCGHGAHPMMNLYEGNVGAQWQHDAYHGSASHQILFRNWLHGLAEPTINRKMIDLLRGSYYCSIVGNVLGDSSWTNASGFAYFMTGEPGYSEQPVIFRFGYPNSGNNDTGETVDNAWQDTYSITYPDVKSSNTATIHGNYNTYTDMTDGAGNGIVWDAGNADHTISNSLYYPSKPSYFGFLNWPPFDPNTPFAVSGTNIPAGYRFFYGTNPPDSNLSTKIVKGPSAATTANAAVRWKDTSRFNATNSPVTIGNDGSLTGVATQSVSVLNIGKTYLTNGLIFLQHASAPTAGEIGGTVGAITNHLTRNVTGKLTNYWSDGTTLWSKQLAP